jgi:hypothetical protein
MAKKQGLMIPKEKKTWTTALLSNKFKQGRGFLKTARGSYCCLGVAKCVIGGKDIAVGGGHLPNGKFGLSERVQGALAAANDGGAVITSFKIAGYEPPVRDKGRGCSFKSIANWINKNL